VEIGVTGATILDSHGMACELCKHDHKIPIIGSLRSFLDSSRPYNKTIFTVVESEELADKAMAAVNDIVHDVSKPGHGLMFTVPVGKIWCFTFSKARDIEFSLHFVVGLINCIFELVWSHY